MSDLLIPYVIRQGDHMVGLAHRRGFDADELWNHQRNGDLRQRRSSMHVLCPGDVLYVPDAPRRTELSLVAGTNNKFAARPPHMTITVKFQMGGEPIANEACTIAELPHLRELATGSDGVLTFETPVTLETATVQFQNLPFRYHLQIGHLDPADTRSGLVQRLRHLGFLRPQPDSEDAIRSAVVAFQRAHMTSLATGTLDDTTLAAIVNRHGS